MNNNFFIIEKLNQLKNDLNSDGVNIQRVLNEIRLLNQCNEEQYFDYIKDLLDPINRKGVKVPSEKPVPTCTFQWHDSYNFTVNRHGCALFSFNPWYMQNGTFKNKKVEYAGNMYLGGTASPFFFTDQVSLDGTKEVATNVSGINTFNTTVPDVYEKYRLVSACMTIRYIGNLDEVKGTIGGCIDYSKERCMGIGLKNGSSSSHYVATSGAPWLKKFGNYDLIRDNYYYKESTCLEGLKMLYFPLDNNFLEFKKVIGKNELDARNIPGVGNVIEATSNSMKDGFNWIAYVEGGPYLDSDEDICNFKIDFYSNFECVPKAKFMNYIPISIVPKFF